ncbi:MAG: tRNA lysidine(34) synthetase TilS [bacterium]|nr:tRNA lysidine(34) synthetase TilS [bacterium]
MGDRVELAFRRAALELIPAESTGIVAVSGGGDSVALLHLLLRYSRTRGIVPVVAHLDHGLRRGSRADRVFVERLARRDRLDCLADRREVTRLRRRDESPEEAARRVRRAYLVECAAACGAGWIATGHTRDDQAETILMRLVRGAGATALAGMAPAGPGPFVRPLLGVDRAALRVLLSRRGIEYRNDPTNRDARFDRNRVRRLILPLLQEQLNPQAARHLVKAAEMLREDASYLDELAARRRARVCRVDRSGRWIADVDGLVRTPPVLAKRVARELLQRAGVDPRRITAAHVAGLLDLARGPGGRELHLPGRLAVRRRKKRLVVEPQ